MLRMSEGISRCEKHSTCLATHFVHTMRLPALLLLPLALAQNSSVPLLIDGQQELFDANYSSSQFGFPCELYWSLYTAGHASSIRFAVVAKPQKSTLPLSFNPRLLDRRWLQQRSADDACEFRHCDAAFKLASPVAAPV